MSDRSIESPHLDRALTVKPVRNAQSTTAVNKSAIRVPKTAEVVVNHIRSRIILGELREGDFLPPEGVLMATLGISRPTLREAFRILEAENLISVVRGSRTGARVHEPKVENVARYAGYALQAQGTTIADIYEARLAIEPYIVRRLAKSHTDEDIARLRVEADRMSALTTEGRYIECMIALAEFHRLLVELGGNRTLLFVTRMLQDVVAKHQVEYFRERQLAPDEQRGRLLWGMRSFYKLIDLIAAGDADRAESHWRLHVINANASWVPPEDTNKIIDALT
jgi:DNA-binding FadR family transcriptional regulator